jgi:FixJ family two-component response regulator
MVLITAFGDYRIRKLARQFGVGALLEKPFEMTALVRVAQGCETNRVRE